MDLDEEIHSLNRREAHIRGNGSQLSSDNSVIRRTRRKSRNRDRRKSPSEMDLNSKKTPDKLKIFAQADKQLERVSRVRNSQGNVTLNTAKGPKGTPLLRKTRDRKCKPDSRYAPVGEALKDTTKLGQTWLKENQLGKYVTSSPEPSEGLSN